MKAVYSPRAIKDLKRIAEYLKERSPRGATAVGRRIEVAVKNLLEFPGLGTPVSEREGVRVMPLVRYPYLVFYEVIGDELIVLHIRHGARQPIEPDEL